MYKSLLILPIIITACSLNTSNDKVQKELDTLTIKENNTHSEKQSKMSNYYIKPLTDSTYTGGVEEKYPNGIVKYKGFYRFGKKHGEWLYFYPNGGLWSEAEFNRDKMHGKSNVYHPNGKLYYSGFYKNNIKDSIWIYYDTTGKELYKEIYKNGRLLKRETSARK